MLHRPPVKVGTTFRTGQIIHHYIQRLVVCAVRRSKIFFFCFLDFTAKKQKKITNLYSLTGSHVGPLIGFPLSGFLASSKGGWPSIFYVTGGLGCLWVVLWYWFGANAPGDHKMISESERTYIETSLKEVLGDSTSTVRLEIINRLRLII